MQQRTSGTTWENSVENPFKSSPIQINTNNRINGSDQSYSNLQYQSNNGQNIQSQNGVKKMYQVEQSNGGQNYYQEIHQNQNGNHYVTTQSSQINQQMPKPSSNQINTTNYQVFKTDNSRNNQPISQHQTDNLVKEYRYSNQSNNMQDFGKRYTFSNQSNGIQNLNHSEFQNDQGRVSNYHVLNHPSTIRTEKEGFVVSEKIGESRLVSSNEGEKRVIGMNTLEPRVTQERTITGTSKVVSEIEMKRTRHSEKREVNVQNVDVEYIKRDKIIEIITEKPFKVERTVDVPYDVYIDVPIERTYEKEKITNIIREIPIEKIVEVPITQIIETPVEIMIEKPVEVQKFVQVPYETIIHKPYDVVRENINYTDRYFDIDEKDLIKYPKLERMKTQVDYEERTSRIDRPHYVDNLIEKIMSREKPRVIEVPREHLIERKYQVTVDRPVQVEKIINREIEVARERQVYHEIEYKVDRPRYIDNIIERPVPVEKIVEREVRVEVPHYVERAVYYDNIIHKEVEHIVEIPIPYEEIIEEQVEQIIEVPFEIEEAQARPTEKIIRKSKSSVRRVEVPVEYPIEKLVPRSVVNTIEKKVNQYTEQKVHNTIERPIYIERIREIPKIVERIIEVEVETIREVIKYVEKIIEKPIYIDTVIEKYIEVIVEKIIEVPVEKIIEVEIEITIEIPQIEEVIIYEDVIVEGTNNQFTEGVEEQYQEDHEDEVLTQQIRLRQLEQESVMRKNKELIRELEAAQQEIAYLSSRISNDDEREHFNLLARFAELNSRYKMEVEQSQQLRLSQQNSYHIVDDEIRADNRIGPFRDQIHELIRQNQYLCAQIKARSDGNLKQIRLSQYRV